MWWNWCRVCVVVEAIVIIKSFFCTSWSSAVFCKFLWSNHHHSKKATEKWMHAYKMHSTTLTQITCFSPLGLLLFFSCKHSGWAIWDKTHNNQNLDCEIKKTTTTTPFPIPHSTHKHGCTLSNSSLNTQTPLPMIRRFTCSKLPISYNTYTSTA